MKSLNTFLKRSGEGRAADRMKILDAINLSLNEYSSRKISLNECLLKTGQLTADLIVYHCSDLRIPRKTRDRILMMVTNYYVILHIDMYTGFYTVNKEFIFKQAVKLSREILDQSMLNHQFKTRARENREYESKLFLKEQVEIVYRMGIDGCIRHLSSSICNEITSADKANGLTKEKIEEVIRSVQSEKFLNCFNV